MARLAIFIGSKSDEKVIIESGVAALLDSCGLDYESFDCSAHRFPSQLTELVEQCIEGGAQGFVGIAGMATALPGAITGIDGGVRPVWGVPLDEDGVASIRKMAPGRPVLWTDSAKNGLKQTFLAILQVFAMADSDLFANLQAYQDEQSDAKQPRSNICLRGRQLAEGKTQKIIDDGVDGTVLVQSKDDITAGDGVKHDVIGGKGALNNRITCNVFDLLNRSGVPTAFIEQVDYRTFRAPWVRMLPLELIVRQVATGSFLKRYPDAQNGEYFPDGLLFEINEKNDPEHDPLLVFDFEAGTVTRHKAGEPFGDNPIDTTPIASSKFSFMTAELFRELSELVPRAFEVVSAAWAAQEVLFVDCKFEVGRLPDGSLVIADVLNNDSWRIWPGGDKANQADKQVYRELADSEDAAAKAKELGKIKENYVTVADWTDKFREFMMAE